MVFHGLGPLGCIPSQRVKSKTGQCLKRVNQWVLEFNSRVQKLLYSLNRRLPNAKLIFADTYPAVLDLIDNPNAYGESNALCIFSHGTDGPSNFILKIILLYFVGFKISNTSCCNVDTSVGGLCLPNSKMCSNRTEYVFWDAFHPTDAANAVLADKLFSSLFSAAQSPAPAPSH